MAGWLGWSAYAELGWAGWAWLGWSGLAWAGWIGKLGWLADLAGSAGSAVLAGWAELGWAGSGLAYAGVG